MCGKEKIEFYTTLEVLTEKIMKITSFIVVIGLFLALVLWLFTLDKGAIRCLSLSGWSFLCYCICHCFHSLSTKKLEKLTK